MVAVIFSRNRFFEYSTKDSPVLNSGGANNNGHYSDTKLEAGPVNSLQFLRDINRNQKNYFFNGKSIYEWMQELPEDEKQQWFEKPEETYAGDCPIVYKFKDERSASAFTRKYLLVNTDGDCKYEVWAAISRNIHQSGLNSVAALAITKANREWADNNTGKEHFTIGEPASECHFSSTARGITLSSIHTYSNGYYHYANTKPGEPSGSVVNATEGSYHAKVFCQTRLECTRVPKGIVITPKKLLVDVQDDRFNGIFDTRSMKRRKWDYIKSFVIPNAIPTPAVLIGEALAAARPYRWRQNKKPLPAIHLRAFNCI